MKGRPGMVTSHPTSAHTSGLALFRPATSCFSPTTSFKIDKEFFAKAKAEGREHASSGQQQRPTHDSGHSGPRSQHLLRLDTIPQLGFAIATWLPTQHRELGTRHPVSSNGPVFRRDHGVWLRAAHRKSRRNTRLSLGGE